MTPDIQYHINFILTLKVNFEKFSFSLKRRLAKNFHQFLL